MLLLASRLINDVLAAVLIGWFAVTAEFFGRTCYLTVQQYFPLASVPLQVYTLVCCLLVMRRRFSTLMIAMGRQATRAEN